MVRQRTFLASLLIAASCCSARAEVTTAFEHRAWSVDAPGEEAEFVQTLLYADVALADLWGPVDLRAYLPVAASRDEALDAEISGAGDAQVRLAFPAAGWSLSLGADIPTGQTALSASEARVAGRMLASRVLDFGLKRPGEGFDLMVGASRALRVGRATVAGLALAGHLKGAYALYEENGIEQTATPGHRLHAAVSLLAREHPDDPDWELDLTLAGQWAGESTLESVTIEEGAQTTVEGRYRHRAGDEGWITLSAYLLGRGENQVTGGETAEVEMLGLATRWVTELGLAYARRVAALGDLTAGVRTAVYSLEAGGEADSRTTALDLALRRTLSERLAAVGSAQFAVGRTPWTATDGVTEERRLTGLTLGVALEFVF